MDQYTLAGLFKRFDRALAKLARRYGLSVKANDCMLVRIQNGLCDFVHMETGMRFRFDTKTDSIVK